MPVRSVTLGGLSCRVIDPAAGERPPSLIVILCHGFGAPGTDLVPIAHELIRLQSRLTDTVKFVFPAGPLSLDEMGLYGGRAWWPLDVARLQRAIELNDVSSLTRDVPAGLSQAREMLTSIVDELKEQTGVPTSRFLLGGFSQGAMLATDVALRLPEKVAGLCILSGMVICEEEWRDLVGQRGALTVLQSHGRQDQILPFAGAKLLKELLNGSGMDVDFVEFNGPHTIAPEVLDRLAQMIDRLAQSAEDS